LDSVLFSLLPVAEESALYAASSVRRERCFDFFPVPVLRSLVDVDRSRRAILLRKADERGIVGQRHAPVVEDVDIKLVVLLDEHPYLLPSATFVVLGVEGHMDGVHVLLPRRNHEVFPLALDPHKRALGVVQSETLSVSPR